MNTQSMCRGRIICFGSLISIHMNHINVRLPPYVESTMRTNESIFAFYWDVEHLEKKAPKVFSEKPFRRRIRSTITRFTLAMTFTVYPHIHIWSSDDDEKYPFFCTTKRIPFKYNLNSIHFHFHFFRELRWRISAMAAGCCMIFSFRPSFRRSLDIDIVWAHASPFAHMLPWQCRVCANSAFKCLFLAGACSHLMNSKE